MYIYYIYQTHTVNFNNTIQFLLQFETMKYIYNTQQLTPSIPALTTIPSPPTTHTPTPHTVLLKGRPTCGVGCTLWVCWAAGGSGRWSCSCPPPGCRPAADVPPAWSPSPCPPSRSGAKNTGRGWGWGRRRGGQCQRPFVWRAVTPYLDKHARSAFFFSLLLVPGQYFCVTSLPAERANCLRQRDINVKWDLNIRTSSFLRFI